jgi:hypothetical protein
LLGGAAAGRAPEPVRPVDAPAIPVAMSAQPNRTAAASFFTLCPFFV